MSYEKWVNYESLKRRVTRRGGEVGSGGQRGRIKESVGQERGVAER